MKEREGKIFDLKPQLTLPMKLAATFAITYYGLLLIFEILVVVYRRYYFDVLYLDQADLELNSHDFLIQLAQLVLSAFMVFNLVLIFRKKRFGKAFFVLGTLLLVAFQLVATGPIPVMKYILELLMMLIIVPLRVKKKIRIKDGKVTLEEVVETPEENEPSETAEQLQQLEVTEQPKEKEPEA